MWNDAAWEASALKRGFCFHCGKMLSCITEGQVKFTTENYHGHEVKLHLSCVNDFKEELAAENRPSYNQPQYVDRYEEGWEE